MLLPGVLLECSANTVQSEKLIVLLSARASLIAKRTSGVVGFMGPEWSSQLAERLSGETFSQRVSVGQWPNAHPAIRVGAQGLAQYNGSELFGWKTSAPNLPNGWGVTPPRVSTGRAPFSESRFMRAEPKGFWGGGLRP